MMPPSVVLSAILTGQDTVACTKADVQRRLKEAVDAQMAEYRDEMLNWVYAGVPLPLDHPFRRL